jgi:transaldolase
MIGTIKIFYDGIDIDKASKDERICGFTTNCSIFAKSSYSSYRDFWDKYKDIFASRPISLQIWKDTDEECIEQIKEIHSVSDLIYVKVPIVNTHGVYNERAIRFAVQNRIRLNITAIHTMDQIKKAEEFLRGSTAPELISIFGGPISDLLEDPGEYIKYARRIFQGKANTELLWAGCREIFTIRRAEEYGCDCITIPDLIFDKLHILNKSGNDLTLDRVKIFKSDAEMGSYTIGGLL